MKLYMKSLMTVATFILIFVQTSCKKETSTQSLQASEEEMRAISEENASADAEYDEVTEIAMTAAADLQVATSEAGFSSAEIRAGFRIRTHIFHQLFGKLGPCTEITESSETFPKTITINYGEGCKCRDGKFRKGIVILNFTNPLHTPGAVLTINLKDYYVNRAHIEGTKIITNLSTAGSHKFSISINKGKINWSNGRGFTYEGSRIFTQVQGIETSTVNDDVYEIEGQSKTIYANGIIVVKKTTSPLIRKLSCAWVVQGIVQIAINDRILFLDFGNGDCDNKAILSWSGGTQEITL